MTRENSTGLIWELKTDDGSLHEKDNTYQWSDSNLQTNGGNPGSCGGANNTDKFILDLNALNFGGFNAFVTAEAIKPVGTANYT